MDFKFNYKEVFTAWVKSFKPTLEEAKLAKERFNVCLSCDIRKEVIKGNDWSAFCGKCGCPLNKKVFSNIFNSCPMEKWKEVDSKYLPILEVKNNKTII